MDIINDNWIPKYKVGQEVRVVKKIDTWHYNGHGMGWNTNGQMDGTIGKVYTIMEIDKGCGYKLNTQVIIEYSHMKWDFWYPDEALKLKTVKGEQYLFDFMKEE